MAHSIICKMCGKKVFINPAANQKYCSRGCRENDPEYRAKLIQRQPHNRIELTCEECGQKYFMPKSQAYFKNGKLRSHYHNRECSDKAKLNRHLSRETVAKMVKANINKKRTGNALKNITESNKKNVGINMNLPVPKLPYRGYRGKDWPERRRLALERDNYACQVCGERHKKLDVDHIVDYPYCYNNDLYNLIALCRSCHRKQNGKYYILNKYALQAILHKRYGYKYSKPSLPPIKEYLYWGSLTINIPTKNME